MANYYYFNNYLFCFKQIIVYYLSHEIQTSFSNREIANTPSFSNTGGQLPIMTSEINVALCFKKHTCLDMNDNNVSVEVTRQL